MKQEQKRKQGKSRIYEQFRPPFVGWKGQEERKGRFEILYLLVLILYPLRHINWGLDFWDTGYNYANFVYMGMEHMDPMWLFSTYLANAAGHLLTKLPFAGNLAGMNFYTGLFVSVLAVMGYLFCTRKLMIPSWIVFLGELAAISLCWCPTALLYNYLTYVLFLGCVILLYRGLTEEKKGCLFAAGICLGTNILVRFSNLPEAALIVAVWAYGVIEALEAHAAAKKTEGISGQKNDCQKNDARAEKNTRDKLQSDKEKKSTGALKRTVYRTLWCLGGYLTALIVLFAYIHIRYGLDAYITGIQRLFAMTDHATDYKAASMLTGLIYTYVENLYWVVRILFIVFVGMALFGVTEWLFGHNDKVISLMRKTMKIFWCAVCLAMLAWLYYRGFCSLEFYSYGSMLRPGILFLMLTMGIAVIRIFHKNSEKEEKLISGILILVILLTSIGSNNGVYPSLNNLFVAAPYTLWQCYRLMKNVGDWRYHGITFCSFPVKGVTAAFLAMFLVQSGIFGACFVFAEATGVQDVTARVENNDILRGIKMNPERAEWMTEISEFAEEQGLQNQEVILYGQIPSLSYYLQMPSAFNPWSDLRSYSLETMERDMDEVRYKMQEDASYRPVVILENAYMVYREGGSEALEGLGMDEEHIKAVEEDGKWLLLVEFLEDYGYEQTFRNEKFAVWQ